MRTRAKAQKILCWAPWIITGTAALSAAAGSHGRAAEYAGELLQILMVFGLFAAVALQIPNATGRIRGFWILMTAGVSLWVGSNLMWCYHDLQLAGPYMGGISAEHVHRFLHLVPMIAALFVIRERKQIALVTSISVAMIAIWWMFLYGYVVIPWQYVVFDFSTYTNTFLTLYTIEDIAYSIGLAILAFEFSDRWRRLFAGLLVSHIGYAVALQVVNGVIQRGTHYGGSPYQLLYFVPLSLMTYSIASFHPTEIELRSQREYSHADAMKWLSLVGLITIPILVCWNVWSSAPLAVRNYRILEGAFASMLFKLLLFFQQQILAKDRADALTTAKESLMELAEAREELEYKATHDILTGGLNRASVLLALHREVARSKRTGSSLAVFIVDLDHFKNINDCYGHLAGDAVLSYAAKRMGECIREHDYIGRYGGEEFLGVVPDCGMEAALDIADRIRGAIANSPVRHNEVEISVTVTVGVGFYRPGDTPEKIIQRADTALYRGKSSGRNRVEAEQQEPRCFTLPKVGSNYNSECELYEQSS